MEALKLVFLALTISTVSSSRERLLNYIFERADSFLSFLPDNPKEHLAVKVGFFLNSISDYNRMRQEVELTGDLDVEWTEKRLTWDPSEFDGIESIAIPYDKLRRPDIKMYTGSMRVDNVDVSALLFSNGTISYVPDVFITQLCPIDDVNTDIITCDITFGSWVYPCAEMKLSMGYLSTHFFRSGWRWELMNITERIKNVDDPRYTDYCDVDIRLQFRDKAERKIQKLTTFFE